MAITTLQMHPKMLEVSPLLPIAKAMMSSRALLAIKNEQRENILAVVLVVLKRKKVVLKSFG